MRSGASPRTDVAAKDEAAVEQAASADATAGI
jgi:hypothetical protein